MIEVNYMFACGGRCNSTDFMTAYKLRQISSPFDYIIVDLETVFTAISNSFSNFLTDVVLLSAQENRLELHYSKETTEVSEKLKSFKALDWRGYMNADYTKNTLLINQNFIDNTPGNVYDWNRCCIFLHHWIGDMGKNASIERRANIFKNIYNRDPRNLCLFCVTKILEIEDFESYKDYIKKLRSKYDISCYLIMIVCSDRLEESHLLDDLTLYIVKRVPSYKIQSHWTDNNIDRTFDKEREIISQYFDLKLRSYQEIKAEFAEADV